jgi:hypothetical protein
VTRHPKSQLDIPKSRLVEGPAARLRVTRPPAAAAPRTGIPAGLYFFFAFAAFLGAVSDIRMFRRGGVTGPRRDGAIPSDPSRSDLLGERIKSTHAGIGENRFVSGDQPSSVRDRLRDEKAVERVVVMPWKRLNL